MLATTNERHARLRLGLVALGVLVIVAFGASTAYDAWRSYHHTVVSTESDLEDLASALGEQTAWSWQGIDSLLRDVVRWRGCHVYGIGCGAFQHKTDVSPERITEFLATGAARAPQVRSLRIIDARGILLYSSDEHDAPGIDLSKAPYVRAQKDATTRGLFMSEPLVLRSEGRTVVVLSRRLDDQQGRFAGVVSAEVDLGGLSRLYATVNLHEHIAIHLLRDDGTLLVRTPAVPAAVGRKFTTLVDLRPGAAGRIRSPFDHHRELIISTHVRASPLVIAVTEEERDALQTWYQETIHGAVRTLLLALIGALTVAALLRQVRRIEQADRALRHSQKMEALGTLAGGIAHDFNNILGAIVGYGELAQQRAPEGSVLRRYLDNIMQAAGRARALVDRILGFSRSGLAERRPIDIQAAVAETLELLEASLPANIRLQKALAASGAAVMGDETRLHQVTMNLCTNAVQAMPDGGVLRVTLERVHLDAASTFSRGQLEAGTYVRLTVSDSGKGIPPEIVDRIFDPFFTTKPVGEGTGLGLALVHGIVTDLGGAIEVSTETGMGTTFCILLPTTSETAKPVVSDTRDLPRGHGQTVMIVDDEPALVSLTEEMLAELGYEPIGFASSTAALRAFRSHPDRFDAVLTDEVMPALRGTELARELRGLRPAVPVIVMSGNAGPQLAERAAAAGVAQLLRKPLQRRDLAEALEKLFEAAVV